MIRGETRQKNRFFRRFERRRVRVFRVFGRDRPLRFRRDFRFPIRSKRRPERELQIAFEFERFRLERFAGIDQRVVERRFLGEPTDRIRLRKFFKRAI